MKPRTDAQSVLRIQRLGGAVGCHAEAGRSARVVGVRSRRPTIRRQCPVSMNRSAPWLSANAKPRGDLAQVSCGAGPDCGLPALFPVPNAARSRNHRDTTFHVGHAAVMPHGPTRGAPDACTRNRGMTRVRARVKTWPVRGYLNTCSRARQPIDPAGAGVSRVSCELPFPLSTGEPRRAMTPNRTRTRRCSRAPDDLFTKLMILLSVPVATGGGRPRERAVGRGEGDGRSLGPHR